MSRIAVKPELLTWVRKRAGRRPTASTADAVRQDKQERDERDLLFTFKQRALVHFAVDPDEVWMSTRLKANGYAGIRSLVAFSGTVEDPDDPGSSYTEVAMNDGLAESELPGTFERDDDRVLLVAEKYQTGFDQPLLQTMYVVKKLAGVQAVQTLSRLNRMAPGKARALVLDFANEEDDIYQAFKPYYEATPIGENADPHRLSGLQHKLLKWAIFAPADVDAFAQVWYRPKREHAASDHRVMNALLDAVVQRFGARGARAGGMPRAAHRLPEFVRLPVADHSLSRQRA